MQMVFTPNKEIGGCRLWQWKTDSNEKSRDSVEKKKEKLFLFHFFTRGSL